MGWLSAWDHAALHWINSHHYPILDWILVPVSTVGEMGAIWIAIGLALLIWGRGRARITGVLLLVSLLVADQLIARPLHMLWHRSRPYLNEPWIRQVGIPWRSSSFPSAHAHSAVIAAILLGGEYRRFLPALVVFAALTLYSRPYLGMHHPSDTLAGAAVGAAVGFAAWELGKRWKARVARRSSDEAISPTPPAPQHPESR